jgi:hypothetical protein
MGGRRRRRQNQGPRSSRNTIPLPPRSSTQGHRSPSLRRRLVVAQADTFQMDHKYSRASPQGPVPRAMKRHLHYRRKHHKHRNLHPRREGQFHHHHIIRLNISHNIPHNIKDLHQQPASPQARLNKLSHPLTPDECPTLPNHKPTEPLHQPGNNLQPLSSPSPNPNHPHPQT